MAMRARMTRGMAGREGAGAERRAGAWRWRWRWRWRGRAAVRAQVRAGRAAAHVDLPPPPPPPLFNDDGTPFGTGVSEHDPRVQPPGTVFDDDPPLTLPTPPWIFHHHRRRLSSMTMERRSAPACRARSARSAARSARRRPIGLPTGCHAPDSDRRYAAGEWTDAASLYPTDDTGSDPGDQSGAGPSDSAPPTSPTLPMTLSIPTARSHTRIRMAQRPLTSRTIVP